MVKLLGIVDIFAAGIIAFNLYGYKAPAIIFCIVGFAMVGKFIISTQNMFGWYDLGVAVVMVIGAIIILPKWVMIIALLSLIKGVTSLA